MKPAHTGAMLAIACIAIASLGMNLAIFSEIKHIKTPAEMEFATWGHVFVLVMVNIMTCGMMLGFLLIFWLTPRQR